MKAKNYMANPDKFYDYMERIWKIATEHGWHEQPLSEAHYCGLIMTEMAEAVEADRKGKRANVTKFKDSISQEVAKGFYKEYGEVWKFLFEENIKDTIEDEFADVVIRIFDMACECHNIRMYPWKGYDDYGEDFRKDKSFVENAWFFIKDKLNSGTMNISDSISYMYAWSDYLGIDLDKHIEWKMKYNELRPYKHGGKKY